jgi:biopolymer transport protein ExbD
MELKRRAGKDFSIDISSLVDVLFTLLIFFSLTSTFVKESGLKVDLPKASSDTPIISAEKFEIAISSDGRIALGGTEVASTEDVKEFLSKFDTDMRLKYVIVIKADATTQHGKVTEILDILKSLKFENIAVATRAKE